MRAILIVLVAVLIPLIGAAQGRRGQSVKQVMPYDSRFVFTRLYYGSGLGGFFGGGGAWSHDYPAADRNVGALLDYISHARVRLDGTNILDLDDPEIFQNPILYVWEPGYWRIGDLAAQNLRDYMLKGGFVIFDDFEADQWINFEAQFRRALPDAVFHELPTTHPLFHAFFDLPTINVPHPSVNVTPAYYGVYEDDDPSKRMMALANHNSDIAEYWEWSGRGFFPVDTTNDAYKLGVNYIIYGLTH
jgi:hypothetical protein